MPSFGRFNHYIMVVNEFIISRVFHVAVVGRSSSWAERAAGGRPGMVVRAAGAMHKIETQYLIWVNDFLSSAAVALLFCNCDKLQMVLNRSLSKYTPPPPCVMTHVTSMVSGLIESDHHRPIQLIRFILPPPLPLCLFLPPPSPLDNISFEAGAVKPPYLCVDWIVINNELICLR